MAEQYDLVVIGTGAAALMTTMQVRATGWRVAVADCRPFGGTCALRGCDPKKLLIGGAYRSCPPNARQRGGWQHEGRLAKPDDL